MDKYITKRNAPSTSSEPAKKRSGHTTNNFITKITYVYMFQMNHIKQLLNVKQIQRLH